MTLSYERDVLARSVWVGALILLVGITCFVGRYALDNFPFTSGIAAHARSPSGEEVCIVQTFKGAEPYQVSLYARQSGQPWVWHYLV